MDRTLFFETDKNGKHRTEYRIKQKIKKQNEKKKK